MKERRHQLAELDDDIILGEITEKDRRAFLEEGLDLNLDWLTV